MPNYKLKQTSEQVQKAIDNALYPDKELTKEGVPADSKAVGDEIRKIPRTATVQIYGAKGDGSTDDTAAFRAALAEERVVFVPGGTYILSGEIVIGNNCMLELSQDTVLEFTNTTGNCINIGMSSNLKGNHATIKVPYWFDGNVLYSYTNDQTSADINAVPPWTKWDPQWKSGRYVTDINICKDDGSQGTDRGYHYAVNPEDCRGTAVYLSADNTAGMSTFMWGVHYSNLRIAGAFSYGIRAVNYDNGWNHEMRIDAFIDACETGVSLEDCSNVYVSAAIQPRRAYSLNKVYAPYAKYGIKLVDSKNVDLSGSRVWDWENEDKPSTTENEKTTLWTNGGEYQHIAMYGNCTGAIVNDFQWNTKGDTRKRIYTDNDQNLETLTVLQEPIDRWFKVIGGNPYYTNGVDNIKLLRDDDLNKLITITAVKNYTDVLAQATDTDGVAIFNDIGYQIGKRFVSLGSGTDLTDSMYYMTTGFIAVSPGQTINAKDLSFDDTAKGYAGIVYYNENRERFGSQTAPLIVNPNSYWVQSYTRTADGFSLQFPDNGTVKNLAYVRMVFPMTCVGQFPTMAVNEPAEPVYKRVLADEVAVRGESIVGIPGQVTPDWVATKKEVGGDTIVISEQTVTSGAWNNRQTDIEPGIAYDVYINDTRYSCVAFDEDGTIYLGNNADMTRNDYPFGIAWSGGTAASGMFFKDASLTYPLKLKVTSGAVFEYNKMPAEYLPDGVAMMTDIPEVSWDALPDKPVVDGAGEAFLTYTATFATDTEAKSGVRAADSMGNLLAWLDVNGELLKVHREQSGMRVVWRDDDGNEWVSSTFGGVYVSAPTAGTYTYTLYTPADTPMLDPKYLPPNLAKKVDIPAGGGSGGTSIDVTAEVGQTIIVKEIDADGKPTKWEAVDYPVGAKIYLTSDIERMTMSELQEEYNKHPIILRYQESGNGYYTANILLTVDGTMAYGIGFSRLGKSYEALIMSSGDDGKLNVSVDVEEILSLVTVSGTSGLLYFENGSYYVKSDYDYKYGAIVNVDPTLLIDGAVISVPVDSYTRALLIAQNKYSLSIGTTDSNSSLILLPALYVSAGSDGYPCTVKCFSPDGGNIITVTLVPEL